MRRVNSNVVVLNVIEDHLVDLRDQEMDKGTSLVEAARMALNTSTGRTVSSEFARYLSDDTITMIYGRPELTKKGKDVLKAAAREKPVDPNTETDN